MSLKKILSLIAAGALTVTLAFAITSCKKDPCEKNGHIDANKDFRCDECSIDMPCDHVDADEDYACDLCGELVGEPPVEEVKVSDFTINIKDEDGAPVAGVVVMIFDGDGKMVVNSKTSADGSYKGSLEVGSYYTSFDIESIEGYIYIPATTITVKESGNVFNYVTIDNTPDGTAERPFFLGEDSNPVIIPASTTYYFTIKGEIRTMSIAGAALKVVYGGETYLPEDGTVSLKVSGPEDPNDPPTLFTVENTSSDDIETSITFLADPGTRSNPYEIVKGESTETAPLYSESVVYYKWVADADCTVTVVSSTEGNRITLTNLETLSTSDTSSGAVGGSVTLANVHAGQEILVTVSVNTESPVSVELTLTTEE